MTFTTSSLGSGAAVTGALARVAGENVGSHAITQGTVTDANNPNYVITFVGANLTITARPVTVTADPQTKLRGRRPGVDVHDEQPGQRRGGDGRAGAGRG